MKQVTRWGGERHQVMLQMKMVSCIPDDGDNIPQRERKSTKLIKSGGNYGAESQGIRRKVRSVRCDAMASQDERDIQI